MLIRFRFKYKKILRTLQNYEAVGSNLNWFTNCFPSLHLSFDQMLIELLFYDQIQIFLLVLGDRTIKML